MNLPAGTYQAVITQGANVAAGPTLAQGFAYDGQGNFTQFAGSKITGGFLSPSGAQTGSSFAMSVAGADSSAGQLSISQNSPGSGQVSVAYSQQLSVTGGTAPFTWTVISGALPPGLVLSPGGQLTGTPVVMGTYSVQVQVADSSSPAMTATQSYQITIAAAPVFPPLTITSTGTLGDVPVGGAVSQTLFVSGGKPPYTWGAPSLPAGVSLSPSGVLSGSAGQAGNFTFTVQVQDAQGATTGTSITLAVLGFAPVSLAPASTTSAYSATLGAIGGIKPYVFTAQGLPDGLSLSGSGILSGTPKKSGSYPFTVQLADSGGVMLSQSLTLVVAAPANLTVSTSLSAGIVNTPYSDTLIANGGAGPYTWSIIGGTLPPGLSASSSGTISGTPTQAGTFSFTAQATDTSGGRASGGVTISIAPPALTVSSMVSLPNGILGSEYAGQIVTPAGGVAPYSFAISSGSLPPGLTFTNGQIGGTPSMSGKFAFTIAVTDSATPPNSSSTSGQILINPATQADLLISASAVPFSLIAGASELPAAASLPVRSSVVGQILSYGVQVSPGAAWLNVSGGGTTPGVIALSLDASAGKLAAAGSPYTATVTVTCSAPSPCAGNSQTIAVTLSVTAPPAQLSVPNSLISFGLTSPGPLTGSQSFGIQNAGGGTLTIKSVAAADGWLTISGAPSSLPAGPATQVVVNANATGLAPGFYRSSITVSSSAGTASVPVTLLLAQNNSMSLSPAGTQFTSQQGSAPGNPVGSFSVTVNAGGSVNWTASVAPGAPWLKLSTPSGSATNGNPGLVSYSIDATAASALAAGACYGMIEVSSPDVYNSPLDFEVVLNVAPVTAPAMPDPEPGGVVFISGSGALPPQTVQVYTNSKAPTAFQVSPSGASWLSVSPTTGMTSATAPASTTVKADPTGLAPGIYTGGVSYAFAGAAVRTVNVTLIVPASGTAPHVAPNATPNATSSCTASKVVPTQTGLVSNFSQPAAWPTPLAILLSDDCGSPVGNGQVVATFSNGDPPLALTASNAAMGMYSGTWTPRSAASTVTITAKASATGLAAASTVISGQVAPNKAPLLTPNATLHVFDPLIGGALSPGNIVQIYGQYLAAQTLVAPAIPQPTALGGTSVIIGGVKVPIYFVSSGQINAQVPFELVAGKKYQILISANGALTTPDTIQLAGDSPGIAAFATGAIIAQHLDGSLVTEAAPAKPAEIIIFYLAGLGLTDNPVTTGDASPGTVLARPVDMPVVTINGAAAPILFGGLTPGLVGLYQINMAVPSDAPDGDLQLVVSQNGVQSNATILPVHK